MRHWKIVLLLTVLLVAIGLVVSFVGGRQGPELVYNGKPLSFWLQAYDAATYQQAFPKGPPPPTWQEANVAIQGMGTNAIPVLLGLLEQTNSRISAFIGEMPVKLPFLRSSYVRLNQNYKAYDALNNLGVAGSNAVPGLLAIYARNKSSFIQQAIPALLGSIGRGAEPAVPLLLGAISHTNQTVRCNAIFALSTIGTQPDKVVPVMIGLLNDPDAAVRVYAVHTLGAYGSDARPAVPALVKLWRNTPGLAPLGPGGSFVRGWSVNWGNVVGTPPNLKSSLRDALRAIDPETSDREGIK